MIFCPISELGFYKGLYPALDAALDAISRTDLSALKDGKNEIDGDNSYINRFSYDTDPSPDGLFECHLRYADVHMVVSGRERVAVARLSDQKEISRDEEKDNIMSEGAPECVFDLVPGTALIVFPGESHRPKMSLNGTCRVEKAVGKVKGRGEW